MDIGPDVNKYTRARGIAGAEIRVAGGPNFRHITINGTGAILQDVKVRQALAMAHRSGGDRQGDARSARHRLRRRSATTSSCGTRTATRTTPAMSASTIRPVRRNCSTRQGGGSTATCGKKDGRTLEINCVIPSAVATSQTGIGADSEHARPDRREVEHQHGAVARLLREIHQARAVRLHGLLVDRHAVSRSARRGRSTRSRPSDREASWPSSRTTHASDRTKSIGCSPRRRRSSTVNGRSSWPIASMR